MWEKVVKLHREKYSYREMKEFNWMMFNNKGINIDIRGSEVDSKWENLLEDVKKIVDESFQLKESKKLLIHYECWVTKSKDKKKLLLDFKNGTIAKEVYINYNRVYCKLIKSKQCSVFKDKWLKARDNEKL